VQVQAPHARTLGTRDPYRLVEPLLEALGPLASGLRIVRREALHVLGDEARALQCQEYP